MYELDAPAIGVAIEMLLNHKDLTLEQSDVVLNALLPLGTFDRNLGKLDGVERL